MGRQPVVVTGMGAITSLGTNLQEFWAGISAGKSGVKRITRFDCTNFPVKVAAEVANFDPAKYLDLKIIDRTSRTVQLGLIAAREAAEMAKLDMSQERPERVGVVSSNMVDSTYIGKQHETLQTRGPKRVDPLYISKTSPTATSIQLGMFFKSRGPAVSVNSLCASGGDAIANAMNFIRLGYADVMIAGGAEAFLDPLTLAGLNVLGALSREENPAIACRPFDLNRSGFVYGEGAGMVVLESHEHAKKRGAQIFAEIAGAAWSFDAYDNTAPYAETEAVAIKTALADADIKPEEIDYINAHGTSTKLNDATETKAIKLVFGERAYKIPVSSSKSMLGHTIAGAGVTEAIICVLAMNNNLIPPTINYETPDPDCDLDYVPNKARPAELKACLSNSFGLGGQNCCLVLKRFKE